MKPLFSSRVLRITGRKTRVWRVVEVEGFEEPGLGKVRNGGSEVALKDVWLDDNSETEKQILDNIFEHLGKVEAKDYDWADGGFKMYLEKLFHTGGYKDYFMEIKYDVLLQSTKSRLPAALPAPGLLAPPEEEPEGTSGNSTRDVLHTGQSANLLNQGVGKLPVPFRRTYRTKRQYRLVYNQVGCPLYAAPTLLVSMQAVRDTFIGELYLLVVRPQLTRVQPSC